MKVLISEKLSEHKYKTPEGYLICTDAILARTGKQSYTKDELFGDGDNTEVNVDRPYDQVMNAKTIASFENKPITFDHPDEDVNVGNYKSYAIGYVRDVHQGKTKNGEDVIMGNLVITDQDAINAIEEGSHTDLSCGYDCDIVDAGNGNYAQNNIRGNHVALCEQGRAGIARIVDSKARDSKIEGVPPELLLSASEWLEDKVYIERKYHVKIYNIISNKGLTVTGSRQDLEKLYKDYHLENGYHLKIVDSKVEDDNLLGRKVRIRKRYSNLDGTIGTIFSYEGTNYDDEVEVKLKNGRHVEVEYEDIEFLDSKVEDASATYTIEYESHFVDWKTNDDYVDKHIKKIVANSAYDAAKKLGLDDNDSIIRVYKDNKLIKTFTSRHVGEHHGRGDVEALRTLDSDNSISIILNKLYNSDYDNLDEVKRDFDRLKSSLSDIEKEKVYNEIALTFGMTASFIRQRLGDSKQTTFEDAIKLVNLVKMIKVKDAWVIKNQGVNYGVFYNNELKKTFPTKKLAIEWVHTRFPYDEISFQDKK